MNAFPPAAITSQPPARPVFILGAGASCEAGVPLMQSIVDDFTARLEGPQREAFAKLVEDLKPAAADGIVDLELVLAALDRIPTMRTDLAAILLRASGDAHEDRLGHLSGLGAELRDYLRAQVCEGVTPERVAYLRPLLMFARQFGTLDVFTLNYDTTIEMIADAERLPWADGFGNAWDAELLAGAAGSDGDPRVRVFKLHGSITWYQRSEYRYLRIPILPSGPLRHFDHGSLREAMIYPAAEKVIQTSLYSRLFQYLQMALVQTTIAIVVGYSLRDAHLMDMLDEALVRNRQLFVVIVNPDAKRLRANLIASRDIRERCLAISAPTGDALAADKLLNTVNTVIEAQQQLRSAESLKPLQFSAAKRAYKRAVHLYNQICHVDGIRSIVALDETSNPFSSGQQADMHLLPDIAGCVWFALTTQLSRESWWLMIAYLLHWFEQDIRQSRTFGVNEHEAPARTGVQVAYTLHPDSVALARELLQAAMEELEGTESMVMNYFNQLDQQLGWLVALRYEGPSATDPGDSETYNRSPACRAAVALAHAQNFPSIELAGSEAKVFPISFR